MNKLVIIGASGHGKVVADIARVLGYTEIVFLDDDRSINCCGNYPIVGTTQEYVKFIDCDFCVAIGNYVYREKFLNIVPNICTLIHPAAVIGEQVQIGVGSVVMAGAVINPGTVIGKGCIINTCSSVDHDCCLGDYVHVSVGAHVAGTVTIGDHTWIGAGATVINNINICKDAMIGAGAVVVKNLTEPGTYIGVPAALK